MTKFYVLILMALCNFLVGAQPKFEFSSFFIENKGQWDKEVLFSGRTRDGIVWILKNGFAFDYFRSSERAGKRLLFRWDNANEPILKDFKLQGGSVNYINQNTSVQTKFYNEIVLSNIYPGIDIRYYFDKGYLRFDLIVFSSGDLTKAKLVIPEQLALKINETNDVEISLEDGQIWISSPVSYLKYAKSPVNINYVADGNILSFQHDIDIKTVHETLIIDPLIYSTYLGGSLLEFGKAVAVDMQGNAYLTGYTKSTNFDIVSGAYQTNLQGNFDVFVAKINPTSNTLIYSTFIGGSDNDYGMDIAINSSGEVFVTGYTASTNYPTTSGVIQTTHDGVLDAFVTALNATGTNLLFSTFIGGNDEDIATGICLDNNNNIYIAGYTLSSNFDVTTGAFQTTRAGNYDVFVTKMNSSGTNKIFSTYLGGSQADYAYDIAVNSVGAAIVTGGTFSSNFDVTGGVYQPTLGGGEDVFLTKFSPNGNNLVFSTYLGGSNDDIAFGVIVDELDYVYLTGHTNSINFDTTAGAYQTTFAANYDAFITKIGTNGTSLVYSTYFGGNNIDYAYGISLDSLGFINVIGETLSDDLPVTPGAHQTTKENGFDIYLLRFDLSASSPYYVTYLGGNSDDYGRSIVCGSNLSVYVTGNSISTNYDVVLPNIQQTNQGQTDVIFTKMILCPSVHPNPSTNSPVCVGDTLFFQANEEPGFTYRWLGPNFFVVDSSSSYIYPVDTLCEGSYYLYVQDTLGACFYSFATNVEVKLPPEVYIVLPEDTICAGSQFQFSASDLSHSVYHWLGPNGFESFDKEPILSNLTLDASGLYYLYVTDAYGCTGIDSALLTVVDCSSLDDFSDTTFFFAYPNPSNYRQITIWSSIPDCAEVYSLDGKWVMEITLFAGKNEIIFPRGVFRVTSLVQQKTLTIFVQ